MTCSPPGSSVHGIFQARTLEWGAIAFSGFRYDLNQIPYGYTVEVRNRFKGLDLKDRVPDELCTEVRDKNQDHPQEKEMQKSKMAV